MVVIYHTAAKQDKQQPLGERKGRKLPHLPLSYIEIPLFWSMRKGNLQKNVIVAYFKYKEHLKRQGEHQTVSLVLRMLQNAYNNKNVIINQNAHPMEIALLGLISIYNTYCLSYKEIYWQKIARYDTLKTAFKLSIFSNTAIKSSTDKKKRYVI